MNFKFVKVYKRNISVKVQVLIFKMNFIIHNTPGGEQLVNNTKKIYSFIRSHIDLS